MDGRLPRHPTRVRLTVVALGLVNLIVFTPSVQGQSAGRGSRGPSITIPSTRLESAGRQYSQSATRPTSIRQTGHELPTTEYSQDGQTISEPPIYREGQFISDGQYHAGPEVTHPVHADPSGTCSHGGCGTGYSGGGQSFDQGGYSDCGGTFDSCESCSDCVAPIRWSAGVEFTLVKPYFDRNVAFTVLQSNGSTTENFSDTEFNYDTSLAPRVWIEMLGQQGLGLRVLYWQFDESPATEIGQPAANGFGRIVPPSFGDIDLSTSVPNSTYTADSALNVYSIDIEATKSSDCGPWGMLMAGGLRYAEVEQLYGSTLVSATGRQQGNLRQEHRIGGLGPTVQARVQRPFLPRLNFFASARGALVYGHGDLSLTAVEDEDLNNALTTTRTTERDDFIPIGELQTGFQWLPGLFGGYQTYVHVGMEAQYWGGVGNATSEDGGLGFFGLNVALGYNW